MKQDIHQIIQRRLARHQKYQEIQGDSLGKIGRSSSDSMAQLQLSSHEQMKRMIVSLKRSLFEQKQRGQQLQQKLQKHMQRSSQRQKEFHKILNSISPDVISLNTASQTKLQKLHSQVLQKFQQSDQKLREKYELCYKQNMTIMQRKSNELVEKMMQQLKKTYKLSQGQHGQLRKLMTRLQEITLQTELQNQKLIKQSSELEFKVRLLNEERRLLLQQLNQKKQLAQKYINLSKQSSSPTQQKKFNSLNTEQSNLSKDIIRARKSSLQVTFSRPTQGNNIPNNHKNTFMYEVMRSKKSSLNQVALTNDIKSLNSTLLQSASLNKDYVESISSLSPNNKHKLTNATQCSRHGLQSPYLRNMINSKHQTIAVRQDLPHVEKHLSSFSPQVNTIASLRNVATRERQRKLQTQTKLAELQQKITAIDRIVMNALIKIKEQQDNQAMTLTSQKQTNFINTYNRSSPKSDRQFLRVVCDKVKNVISGNVSGLSNGLATISLNKVTKDNNEGDNTKELLELLNVRDQMMV